MAIVFATLLRNRRLELIVSSRPKRIQIHEMYFFVKVVRLGVCVLEYPGTKKTRN